MRAICEQLIDTQAAGIVWAITRAAGERHPAGPWNSPQPDALDNPALLTSCGLAKRGTVSLALATGRPSAVPRVTILP